LGQGAAVLAGQNVGARKLQRAAQVGWLAVGLSTALMATASAVIWIFDRDIIMLFNNEPNVLAIGSIFLKIQVVTFLASGCTFALSSCLNGVGDTLVTMMVTVLSWLLVQLPLAYYLSKNTGLGANGAYWAVAIGTIAMAAVYALYFRAGIWKRRRI
jgi:Na+-driven multidrug efflux pump